MKGKKSAARLPEWLSGMPNHTQLGTVELAQIFGVHKQYVKRCVDRGTIPPPTINNVKVCRQSVYRWHLGDIRKWIAEKERDQ